MEGGGGVAWMATACTSNMGERDWSSDHQGVESPWPLDLAQKDTQR